jgi:hypothetical protein
VTQSGTQAGSTTQSGSAQWPAQVALPVVPPPVVLPVVPPPVVLPVVPPPVVLPVVPPPVVLPVVLFDPVVEPTSRPD